jgi:hypothetical protein
MHLTIKGSVKLPYEEKTSTESNRQFKTQLKKPG